MIVTKSKPSDHRMSKADARYTDSAPKTKERCAGCVMFRGPDKCTLVRGEIAPGGWCKYWEAK